jgi:hypothetical protein
VLLDRRVRWQVRRSGGATDELLDLRGARLSGVDLAAGATGIELRLPAPAPPPSPTGTTSTPRRAWRRWSSTATSTSATA